jgi:hypothetical protein
MRSPKRQTNSCTRTDPNEKMPRRTGEQEEDAPMRTQKPEPRCEAKT